jgi:hypothetical protein
VGEPAAHPQAEADAEGRQQQQAGGVFHSVEQHVSHHPFG